MIEEIVSAINEMFLELGAGFSESVYQNATRAVLEKQGFSTTAEIPLVYYWRGVPVGAGRYDIVATRDNIEIIFELKATTTNKLRWIEKQQLKNYLQHSKKKHGILINFPQIENWHESGIISWTFTLSE